ncbi:pyroglutamyl-peptidase I [Afipia massiliensis]|uniref:Pyrrolidone-carboxylate peptidase n=1 Tax=Afipia massiliensis TaxID=211460 RepID=A0A4V6Y1G3_9BRAD|nr:pyroglutamyl-peptidase I [Afipia massiliensis]TKT74103.1 pyroglutamyl-peptidase I [Afipia massiliensis]
MGDKPRILVTGFQPFPGAPYNPTEKLVERLLRLRRPVLDGIERIGHIFPVTYSAVDRELPALIATHRPDALLMFGLATRSPYVRVETRARNTVTQIWPDAEHTQVRSRTIVSGLDSTRRFGPHTLKLLRAAQQTGVDARASLSAGYYLCNYLSWRAIELTRAENGPRLASFIHVPLVPRGTVERRAGSPNRVTFEQLVDAGEAVLMEMARLARHRAN